MLLHLRQIHAIVDCQHVTMQPTIQPYAKNERVPPRDLPATPDNIDLDRLVADPDYRRAVKDLLRRWGIRGDGRAGRH